jgi:ArsR family transcriptional regulator
VARRGDALGQVAATLGGATDPTISHHLGQLSRAGLLVGTRQGASIHCAVDRAALGALVRVIDPNCC